MKRGYVSGPQAPGSVTGCLLAANIQILPACS